MSKISNIKAREILDSRGNPTVEVDVYLENGLMGRAGVPSGASTGVREALELRDGGSRYGGKGVLTAIKNIEEKIKPILIGEDVENQKRIDNKMIELDGTKNKSNLGANAILGVSLACMQAAALDKGKPLYEYLGKGRKMPRMMFNILNGGQHADNNLDIQEYLLIPIADTAKETIRMGSEIFHKLKSILKSEGLSTAVGDEGGFAPNLKNNKVAFDYIVKAISDSGYIPGSEVYIGIDAAASEFYKDGKYHIEGREVTNDQLINFYDHLVDQYPLILIEDGMAQDDFEGWEKLTTKLGNIQLVGDDLYVTNPEILKEGIKKRWGNSVLIKVNQIGTVSEAIETAEIAKKRGFKTFVSHRSGETTDTYIADLVVGLDLGQIKTGSLSRGERVAKYNRLLRIEEEINEKA